MIRLGVLASHAGTNFQAIAEACASDELDAAVSLLITNNSRAGVVERARQFDVPTVHLSSKTHPEPSALDHAMCDALQDNNVQLVVLAGYMKKLGPSVLEAFQDRIINVHPALLPKHGGAGLYGEKVHAAVLAAGETQTGATVHLVSEAYDEGAIILQEAIDVLSNDTTSSLAERLRPVEHALLIQAIKKLSIGIDIDIGIDSNGNIENKGE